LLKSRKESRQESQVSNELSKVKKVNDDFETKADNIAKIEIWTKDK
jgi:hypothetical protein